MRAIVKDESVLSTSCPRGFFLEFYLRSESENNGSARSPSWVLVILNDGLQKQDRRHLKETVELETVFGFP
jgi:hypothetical protein